jgi:phage N-6-adenine-methyltransferase
VTPDSDGDGFVPWHDDEDRPSRPFLGAALSSATPEWSTPAWLVAQLAAEFGPFDLDPAATAANAKAPVFYTAADDGLAQPWKGRVFMNPPYGRTIGRWIAKAQEEVAAGRAELVVCLVPARVDTSWWRTAAAAASLARIWPGRISFGGADPAPFPSAVVVFGTLPGRHGTEPRSCAWCRRPWFPARSDAKTCSAACRQALRRSQVTGRKRDRKRPSRRQPW